MVTPVVSMAQSKPTNEKLKAIEGDWLYVKDRTAGRATEKQGPPMSVKFSLRVEKDAVIMVRGNRPEERISLNGTISEVAGNGTTTRNSGKWDERKLLIEKEIVRNSNQARVALIQMEFEPVSEGLLVHVPIGETKQVALYQHPDDIELRAPYKAKIADLAWLTGAWISTTGKTNLEERWSPPRGGSLLGVSRTVKAGKMVAFEFLRVIERDGGLIYVAQPGGRQPTEFVLVDLSDSRAVFENPRHDFPQRIVYESSGNRLTASIGFINGGRPQRFEFESER